MVPFPVIMVPIYGMFRNLGWIGTFRPLWVPSWFGSAFSIFLYCVSFSARFRRNSPKRRGLTAVRSGAIFRQVILPLSKPALSVVALFTFNGDVE